MALTSGEYLINRHPRASGGPTHRGNDHMFVNLATYVHVPLMILLSCDKRVDFITWITD